MTRTSSLLGAMVLAALGAIGWVGSGALPASAVLAQEIDTSSIIEMTQGAEDAPVEVIEYASYTCPHCRSFHEGNYKKLKAEYIDTGKVRLIQRDFPFDAPGMMGAMMARCANPLRYHQFIDVLFSQQAQWAYSNDPRGALMQIGKLGGLSEKDFNACLQNEELLNGILQMRQKGSEEYDISSTPTFIINGEKVVGNQSLETFEEAIEKHLN